MEAQQKPPYLSQEIQTMIIASVPGHALPKAWFNFRQVSRAWKRDTEFVFSKYYLKKLTIEIAKNSQTSCKLEYAGLTGNGNQLAVFRIADNVSEWAAREALSNSSTVNGGLLNFMTTPLDVLTFGSDKWCVHMPEVASGSPQLAGLAIHGDPREKKLSLPWIPLMNALLGEEYIWRRRLEALTDQNMHIFRHLDSSRPSGGTERVELPVAARAMLYSVVSRMAPMSLREVEEVQDLHRRYIGLPTMGALSYPHSELVKAGAKMCWEARRVISNKWVLSEHAQDFVGGN